MQDGERTILIVEDAEECSATLEIALASLPGLTLKVVGAAEDALRFLDGQRACALIADLHLPGMSGLELIRNVRSRPDLAATPVLVVSGDTDPGTPQRVLRLGANAFFGKPYSPAELRRKLEQLIYAA